MSGTIRIVARHFVAGVVHRDGRVVRAAPILRYMIGWDGQRVAAYCRRGYDWVLQYAITSKKRRPRRCTTTPRPSFLGSMREVATPASEGPSRKATGRE